MCEACKAESLPLAHFAHGYVRAVGVAASFAGLDGDAATLSVPARLPATGQALIAEVNGRMVMSRFIGGVDLDSHARHTVAKSGRSVATGTVIHVGGDENAPVTLVRVDTVYQPLPSLEAIWDGSAPLMGPFSQMVSLTKASPLDPLKVKDFDRITASLADLITKSAGGVETAALDTWLKGLDFRWRTATEAQLKQATSALNQAMEKVAGGSWLAIRSKLKVTSQKVASDTAESMKRTHDLKVGSHLATTDRGVIDRAVSANAHYIRDYYGRVSPRLSAQMRNVAGFGLEAGLSEFEIAEMMRREMAGKLGALSKSYYGVVSNAVAGRARGYSQLRMMERANIERFQLEAVLDEVTTPTCRFLHKKIITVGSAMARYRATDQLKDPTDIKYTQPLFQERLIKTGDHAGKTGLYIPQRGDDVLAAVVERSGYGTKDDIGEFSSALSAQGLEEANVGMPIYHYKCRTTAHPFV